MNAPIALVDGQAADHIAVTDRGFQFGDGVFETLRISAGRPRFVHRHLHRLVVGCARLGMRPAPQEALLDDIAALATQIPDGVVKLVVTRGSSERGYRTPEKTAIRRTALAWPMAAPFADRFRVRLCDTRLANQPLLAGIKHLNRLEQILARSEWSDGDIHEGIMLDYGDRLIEGTMSNLFLVRDETLLTPDLEQCGVAGIVRSVVMDVAGELGIDVVRRDLERHDLRGADEVFVCNALIGVRPVCEWIGETQYPAGPITAALQSAVERTDPDNSDRDWYAR